MAVYAVLVAFALFYLMPIYVLLITGLKAFTEVSLDRMWTLPQSFSLDSFRLTSNPAIQPIMVALNNLVGSHSAQCHRVIAGNGGPLFIREPAPVA